MALTVHVRIERNVELFGGAMVLAAGDVIEARLSLAVHLVRNGMAMPINEDGRAWLCIGLWLQERIPPPAQGNRARRARARVRQAGGPPVVRLACPPGPPGAQQTPDVTPGKDNGLRLAP